MMYQGVLNERVTEHYQQVKMEIFFFFVFLSIIFWYDCMMKLILQSLYRDHQCAKSMHHKQPVKCALHTGRNKRNRQQTISKAYM